MEPLNVKRNVSNSTIYAQLGNTLTIFMYLFIHSFISLFLFFNAASKSDYKSSHGTKSSKYRVGKNVQGKSKVYLEGLSKITPTFHDKT